MIQNFLNDPVLLHPLILNPNQNMVAIFHNGVVSRDAIWRDISQADRNVMQDAAAPPNLLRQSYRETRENRSTTQTARHTCERHDNSPECRKCITSWGAPPLPLPNRVSNRVISHGHTTQVGQIGIRDCELRHTLEQPIPSTTYPSFASSNQH